MRYRHRNIEETKYFDIITNYKELFSYQKLKKSDIKNRTNHHEHCTKNFKEVWYDY